MRKRPASASGEGCEEEVNVADEGEKVTLDELKKRMAEFTRERDWDQFHSPRNLLLALVGEVGELSEIFQWKGEVARGLDDWKDEEKQHLGEELSDVLLYLVRLADVCGIDLGKAALRKLELNAAKYPVQQSKGSSKKYTQINEITTHGSGAVADPSFNSDSNGPSDGGFGGIEKGGAAMEIAYAVAVLGSVPATAGLGVVFGRDLVAWASR